MTELMDAPTRDLAKHVKKARPTRYRGRHRRTIARRIAALFAAKGSN